MNILIIGAGAIGSLFGSLLAQQANVTLLSTNRAHVAAIRENGLLVEKLDGPARQSRIPILSSPDQYQGQADCILICTKAGATVDAARSATGLLSSQGMALSLQNGLGNYEQIAAHLGKHRAMAGSTSQAATLLAPGRIRHTGAGSTQLAADAEQGPWAERLAELFRRSGIATEIVTDRERLLWSKLIVNVGINALAALLRAPNGVLGKTPACRQIMAQAVTEALQVASALHIHLDSGEQPFAQVLETCRLTASNRASMLQDILKRQGTEIDAINGAVAQKAQELGLAAPVNRLLAELVKALEATAEHRL